MRILFLEAVQNFGGARKSTVELATRLMNNGDNKIKVVDFWGSCQPFIEALKENQIPYSIIDERSQPFILSSSKITQRVINYAKYIGLLISYRKKMSIIIQDFKPDLIIVNNTKTLSILRKSREYKITYFARGWFLPQTISNFNRLLIRKNVDKFIGVSSATRAALFAGEFAQLKDIFVVHNAIDLDYINSIKLKSKLVSWHESSARPFLILHCGGFLQSKGQDVMISIAKNLKSRNVNFKIKLVGIVYKGEKSESYLNFIQKKVTENGLDDQFEFVINQTNVLEEFANCDILVHPSETEGLPRVIMESMAFGKPVVANPVGGVNDFIIDNYNGFITNHNDIENFSSSIYSIYGNRELYKKMSERSIETISSSFTKENQLNSFNQILNKIKC